MALKLTKRLLDAMKYEGEGKSQDIRWDALLRGFGVRLFPSGAKTFVVGYRSRGRWRLLKLGSYGVLTVDQARKQAQGLLAQTLEGDDPATERKKERHTATIETLCREYLERHAIPRKKSSRDDVRLTRRYIVAKWGKRKVDELSRAEVSAYHHEIGKTSVYEANRMLSCLSKMFSCAVEWGFLPENAGNPCHKVKRFREEKRSRYLKPDELPNLAKAIEAETNPHVKAFFWLSLLTGLRRGELLSTRWSEVDLAQGIIHFETTKSGRAFDLPLSGQAVQILSRLPRMRGNSHVFPSPVVPGAPLNNVNKVWYRVCKRAGLQGVRIHDLRRTCGSWVAQNERNIQLVSKVLNHQDISVTASVYGHLAETQVRGALDRHGAAIMAAAKTKAAKVINLKVGGR